MTCFAQRLVSAWLLVLVPAAHLAAEEDLADPVQEGLPAQYGDRPKHAARVTTAYEANLAKHKNADDVLVLSGLVADRKARRVEIMAEATGLDSASIVEFLLIDAGSSKGYEALLWSFARPSDVHRALEFIGMKPGKPFCPAKLRFWSKGERVVASVAAWNDPGAAPHSRCSLREQNVGSRSEPRLSRIDQPLGGDDVPTRLERLVIDRNTGKPLPEIGFVFAGSLMVNGAGRQSGRAYAADVLDPKSVASIYNDPATVMDVPRRARQGAVYGTQIVGPAYDFAKHEFVKVILEPEYKDGRRRVVDLGLEVGRSAAEALPESDNADRTEPASTVQFLLTDAAGRAMTEKPQLSAVLGVFGTLIRQGHDPCVSVRFDAALRLAEVEKVCRFIAAIDSESGIRVEPPAPGQLYYEALLPDMELLDPESRITDPWELNLVRSTEEAREEITASLTLHESIFVGGKSKPKTMTFDVETPDALRRQLDADATRRKADGRRPGPPVLMVFADANLTYGPLVDFLGPALTTHNIVHVFLKSEPDQ